jgi:hypothetical protein
MWFWFVYGYVFPGLAPGKDWVWFSSLGWALVVEAGWDFMGRVAGGTIMGWDPLMLPAYRPMR